MRFTNYLRQVLLERLDRFRVLVWYDGEKAFNSFVREFKAANCRVVVAEVSHLQARREAESIYQELGDAAKPASANNNLLIYLPRARSSDSNTRAGDPFELFAAAGDVFGVNENERLQSLAHAALPDLVDQIDELFLTGQPSFEILDRLKAANAYPLLEEALGTQAAVEVCAQLLGAEDMVSKLEKIRGAREQLLIVLKQEFGFLPSTKAKSIKAVRDQLGHYILLSELAFDLPDPWPESLSYVTRAEFSQRDRIYAVCDRLRNDRESREAYLSLANQIERDLKLKEHFQSAARLGQRDTFAFEEKQYLSALTTAIQSNDLASAHDILIGRRKSVWAHQPERALLWRIAERCVELLETASRIDLAKPANVRLVELTESYCREKGWSALDHCQRLMEQSIAECPDIEEVQAVIDLARRQYRATLDQIQDIWLKRISVEGWPPEGVLRQSQVFDRFIAPALDRRDKVAYILADSLRFEMGRALSAELGPAGDVELTWAAAMLPTITPNGMAALLPGADGALSLRSIGDDYVPHLGNIPLKNSEARLDYLANRYGSRFNSVTLEDWLDNSDKKRNALAEPIDLLVVRMPDIDELGERVTLRQARKYMSDLLGDLKSAITQFARHGFNLIVIAADHGHVLLPEVLAGDTVPTPPGQWGLNKRRAKLGSRTKEQAGSLIFKPGQIGIQTDAEDFCVPSGFSVYSADANYFHEGVSLQECIIPVISLRTRGLPSTSSKHQDIKLLYPKDKFTSQVIGLKIHYSSLLGESIQIKLEAYDASALKGAQVGEAADCAARDDTTHEVTLLPNTETDVPVLISPEFKGTTVEIRAVAPDNPNLIWAKLRLKNAVMD